jgi:hypothetical protein
MTTAQSPAFTTAVRVYCEAHQRGIRDMSILGPLVKRLTKREIHSTRKTWQALDQAHSGKITDIAVRLVALPKDEHARTIDFWSAVMEAMQPDQPATQTAPLGMV